MYKYFYVGAMFLFVASLEATEQENVLIKTPLGSIKGTLMQTVLGKTIYAFKGIRYGKAPINELRFQPPVPVDPWTGVYEALESGATCPQPKEQHPTISEDCLFLDVYSTELPNNHHPNVKKPVFVFIHPGGYYSGSAEIVNPEYFLDREVVLVGINYRVAALGFISTGDHLATGNYGLKDQVLAFKWIRDNIASYGGDPNLVTISGYSAGGSSVSLHLVSPMSRGLFHRAIIMSGSSFGNWPVPEEQFSLAQKQANLVGCPNDTSANIIECLRTKTSKELGETLYKFDEFGAEPIIIWYPVVEKDFGQERFLTDDPATLVQCGNFAKVPVMVTVNEKEFSAHALYILKDDKLVKEINDNFEKVAPISFIYERDTENSKHISKELKKHYFGNAPINNDTISGLENIFADGVVGFTIHRAADLLASKNTENVYYYKFGYQGRYSLMYLPGTTTPYGVVHYDDLMYVFFNSWMSPKFNVSFPEYKMASQYTTLLANFAKTGNPTPTKDPQLNNLEWKPYTFENKEYLDIGETLTMKNHLFKERYEVWDRLFPFPTCKKF